jgi:hypothetical protein
MSPVMMVVANFYPETYTQTNYVTIVAVASEVTGYPFCVLCYLHELVLSSQYGFAQTN